jgi:hypothetical protein
MNTFKTQIAVAAACFTCSYAGAVGSWIPLSNTMGTNAGHMLLLSDATVMVENQQFVSPAWFRLIPDNTGGYTNGTFTNMASMSYSRTFFSSQVLQDGRVFIAGGEHPDSGPQITNAEVYNPFNNHWTTTPDAGVAFKDSESTLLPNGTVMVNPVGKGTNPANSTLIYDPTANTWSLGPITLYSQDEATWVKLPDQSILTIDLSRRSTERYIPSLNQWIPDQDIPVDIFTNSETGPAFLLPDGRAFFMGNTGHSVLYTPSGTTNQGSWVVGPDIPNGLVADDVPAAMMANGKILCAFGAGNANGGSQKPVFFYEYDYSVGAKGAFAPTSSPTNSTHGAPFDADSYGLSMVDLPDGTVLVNRNGDSTGQLYVYKPDSTPVTSGKPTIKSVSWNSDGSIHLTGLQFNGISEGSAFGDDCQEDSNFPIVRLTDSLGHISYATTFNWSSTCVMTSNSLVTTEANLPAAVFDSPGKYSLVVIANGIASDPVTFYGPLWADFNYTFPLQNGTFPFPYQTLAQGTNAVASGGTVAINASVQPSDSHETMTISKPMTIISVYGPSTIGH